MNGVEHKAIKEYGLLMVVIFQIAESLQEIDSVEALKEALAKA